MYELNPTCRRLLLAGALLSPSLALANPDMAAFSPTAFAKPPVTVDCTLENGAASKCYEIEVNYQPEGLEVGPFCPATLDDVGGIWDWTGDNPKLYRLDGAFWRMLDAQGYRFFDDDGAVHQVDNATSPPTVDHACINVAADSSVKITMLLPVTPVMGQAPTALGTVSKIGVALDGAPIFADAPSVQERGHLPALDTCGGHIDPGGWYHWHATATDIDAVFAENEVDAHCALPQDGAAQFGYAFDGFALLGRTEADGATPENLDACNGHVMLTDGVETYHYHATLDFPNLPTCLVGVQAKDNFSTTAAAGIGAAGQMPGQMPPGFDTAAAALGITTEALMQALDLAQGGRPDFAAAAEKLGISEDALRAALPPPPEQ